MSKPIKVKRPRHQSKMQVVDGAVHGSIFGRLKTWELLLFILPLVACIALAVVLVVTCTRTKNVDEMSSRALREVLLTTKGEWKTFEEFGVDVWLPKDLDDIELESGMDSTIAKASYDDMNALEWGIGVCFIPNSDGIAFDLSTQMDTAASYINPVLEIQSMEMLHGSECSLIMDKWEGTLCDSIPMVVSDGEAHYEQTFVDSSIPAGEEGHSYSKDRTAFVYYQLFNFHNRLCLTYCVYSASIIDGYNVAESAVSDAVISLVRSDDDVDVTMLLNIENPNYEGDTSSLGVTYIWSEEDGYWYFKDSGERASWGDESTPDDPRESRTDTTIFNGAKMVSRDGGNYLMLTDGRGYLLKLDSADNLYITLHNGQIRYVTTDDNGNIIVGEATMLSEETSVINTTPIYSTSDGTVVNEESIVWDETGTSIVGYYNDAGEFVEDDNVIEVVRDGVDGHNVSFYDEEGNLIEGSEESVTVVVPDTDVYWIYEGSDISTDSGNISSAS